MLGLERNRRTGQVDREVERATSLLVELFGLSAGEASVVLAEEAAAGGVSLHAAALAVVANRAARMPALEHVPPGLPTPRLPTSGDGLDQECRDARVVDGVFAHRLGATVDEAAPVLRRYLEHRWRRHRAVRVGSRRTGAGDTD